MSCNTSKGPELPEANVFVEAGVSGSIEFQERPDGGLLFTLLVQGDMIVFPRFDRAFRNTRHALNVIHDLEELGVGIPIVGDKVKWKAHKKKSLGYKVIQGSNETHLRLEKRDGRGK